jgi:hypothetical protein
VRRRSCGPGRDPGRAGTPARRGRTRRRSQHTDRIPRPFRRRRASPTWRPGSPARVALPAFAAQSRCCGRRDPWTWRSRHCGLRQGAPDRFATACPRGHRRASGGRPASYQAVSGNSGRHGPAWLRPVYCVGASRGTRHTQAASRGLRQTGGCRGRGSQRNRVLQCRAAHSDAAIFRPAPGSDAATPFRQTERPPHAARLRPTERPPHAARLR